MTANDHPGSTGDMATGSQPSAATANPVDLGLWGRLARSVAGSIVAIAILFLLNNYLNIWQEWPGVVALLASLQWFGMVLQSEPLTGADLTLGWVQLLSYPLTLLAVVAWVFATPQRRLNQDAKLLTGVAAYIVRAAFFTVLIVGVADALISLLRVEALLPLLVGEELIDALARPHFRGLYVHCPLIALAFLIALFSRSLGFIWLALLVVFGEFLIVILSFVFSYEQAFMGDLVRFWYAALFLFASAHTLLLDGHVRVDVLYAHFKPRAKAWANSLGLLLLGLPLCWVILSLGMWDKTSSINSPLLNFEVSQSGYGMYVKYLMVAFLVIFALSMIVQFASYLLSNLAVLLGEPSDSDDLPLNAASSSAH